MQNFQVEAYVIVGDGYDGKPRFLHTSGSSTMYWNVRPLVADLYPTRDAALKDIYRAWQAAIEEKERVCKEDAPVLESITVACVAMSFVPEVPPTKTLQAQQREEILKKLSPEERRTLGLEQ